MGIQLAYNWYWALINYWNDFCSKLPMEIISFYCCYYALLRVSDGVHGSDAMDIKPELSMLTLNVSKTAILETTTNNLTSTRMQKVEFILSYLRFFPQSVVIHNLPCQLFYANGINGFSSAYFLWYPNPSKEKSILSLQIFDWILAAFCLHRQTARQLSRTSTQFVSIRLINTIGISGYQRKPFDNCLVDIVFNEISSVRTYQCISILRMAFLPSLPALTSFAFQTMSRNHRSIHKHIHMGNRRTRT